MKGVLESLWCCVHNWWERTGRTKNADAGIMKEVPGHVTKWIGTLSHWVHNQMDIMQKFTEVSQGERVELPVALRLPQDLDFLQSWQYYIEHDMAAMNVGKGSVFRPLKTGEDGQKEKDNLIHFLLVAVSDQRGRVHVLQRKVDAAGSGWCHQAVQVAASHVEVWTTALLVDSPDHNDGEEIDDKGCSTGNIYLFSGAEDGVLRVHRLGVSRDVTVSIRNGSSKLLDVD